MDIKYKLITLMVLLKQYLSTQLDEMINPRAQFCLDT